MLGDLYFTIVLVISLVLATTVHEFCHAWLAHRFGDPTGQMQGRLTLNPLAHLDVVGLLMIFLIHIGWAKPVEVNPHYFRHPRRDNALTALAGPFSNLVMALFLAVITKYLSFLFPPFISVFLGTFLDVNIMLFVFNMLPFPPLDGSKIVEFFIPQRYQKWYQRYLHDGMGYFVAFLVVDQFVLYPFFHYSLVQLFLGNLFVFVKTLLFLGS